MRQAFRILVLSSIFCACFVLGQDQPSLGDAARQVRQEKQQKSAQGKDGQSQDPQGQVAEPARGKKVITNDEIPEHPEVTASSADQPHDVSYSPSPSSGPKMSAEQWKSRIIAQKNMIASLQSALTRLNNSIHFANCSNCVLWNQRQREKQQQVERMQAQLDDQKKRLEDMQETARRQGYGNSVYDP